MSDKSSVDRQAKRCTLFYPPGTIYFFIPTDNQEVIEVSLQKIFRVTDHLNDLKRKKKMSNFVNRQILAISVNEIQEILIHRRGPRDRQF